MLAIWIFENLLPTASYVINVPFPAELPYVDCYRDEKSHNKYDYENTHNGQRHHHVIVTVICHSTYGNVMYIIQSNNKYLINYV